MRNNKIMIATAAVVLGLLWRSSQAIEPIKPDSQNLIPNEMIGTRCLIEWTLDEKLQTNTVAWLNGEVESTNENWTIVTGLQTNSSTKAEHLGTFCIPTRKINSIFISSR